MSSAVIPQRHRTVLQHSRECLVVRYDYLPRSRRFVLVAESPGPCPKDGRELSAWEFAHVHRFEFVPAKRTEGAGVGHAYVCGRGSGALVIQGIYPHQTSASHRKGLEIDFGTSFGSVRVSYELLILHRREATVEKRGVDYAYFDSQSKHEFEFTNPFPALSSEQLET